MSSLKRKKIYNNDDLIYEGEVNEDNIRNGYGVSYIKGLKEYDGYWLNG